MRRFAYFLLILATAVPVTGCSGSDQQGAAGPVLEETAPPVSEPASPPPPPPPPPVASTSAGHPSGTDTHEGPVELPPPPASHASGDQPHLAGGQPPVEPPAAEPSAAPDAQVPVAPPPSGQPSVRLSTGVALPQTTPVGTVMSFSVEYQFTRGGPDPSSSYVWVIARAGGQPAKLGVRLMDRGTLQGFVQKWRPQDGPFRTHLEDRHGIKLSRSIPLR